MAFKRHANALVSKPNIQFEEWMDEIRSQNEGALPKNQISRMAKTILQKVDPNQYLLSHATIVASVDTYEPKGSRTGKLVDDRGIQIDVRYPNYRVKPDTQQYINNNRDAFERGLLLASYRTFVGAFSFVEHLQIPELSKGFVVDAIARDLGDTCYIDILVANDRKHNALINDILSGKINALSMGCTCQFTICTRCGNVAVDDTQSCSHIAYDGKGSKFIDEDGIEHILSELLGHASMPNSLQFIEASWVHNPAFAGAVRRNLLNAEMPNLAAMNKSGLIYELKKRSPIPEGKKKAAAALRFAQDEDKPEDEAGGDLDSLLSNIDEEEGGGEDKPEEKEEKPEGDAKKPSEKAKDKIDELLDKAQESILEVLVKNLSEKLAPKPEDVGVAIPGINEANYNDSLVRASKFDKQLVNKFGKYPKIVKWASKINRIILLSGKSGIKRAGLNNNDLIIFSWVVDRVRGKQHPAKLYKLSMKVGSINLFPTQASYLAACKMGMGRPLSGAEKQFLVRKGRIAALADKL